MKKLMAVVGLVFCLSTLYSQTKLNFCAYVEQNGYCVFNNTKFITSPDSTNGRIYMQVKSTELIGTKVIYKVYAIGKSGEEKLVKLLDQDVQADWLMAWEPYTFATDAKYTVKVYNDADKMICSKSLELTSK